MGNHVITTTAFPQSGGNRSRNDAVSELASHHGGEDRPDVQKKVGKSWEAAIREYNSWLWKFNRVTAEIDLTAGPDSGTDEYDLETDFAEPNRAKLVDTSGIERDWVQFVPFAEWLVFVPDRNTTGSRPLYYTFENIHETGRVQVYPPLTSSPQWPTLRLYYFRRILIPTDNAKLNVPLEVDEGIFQLALAKSTHKIENFAAAQGEYQMAHDYRRGLEHRYRDFPDII